MSYVTAIDDGDAQRVVVVDVSGTPGARNTAQPFESGPPRSLLMLPKGTTLFALADDGKRVLAATPVETQGAPRPMTVVLSTLALQPGRITNGSAAKILHELGV